MNLHFNKDNILDSFRNLNYNDLIIFLIPFILFSYYLYIFNPGILSFDSYNQLHQIATGQFNNMHPFFHTFIEMICLKIYNSTLSICVFQILVFSIMWTIICKYTRFDDKDKINLNKQFILQIILTLFISVIPINAIYSITLWKDVLYSYFLMFLCFLIYVMVNKSGKVSNEFILILSLVMAIVAQLRFNGIYIIIILIGVLGIYLLRKDKPQKNYLKLPALTIIFILLIASLNVAYNVQDNEKDAIFAKTAHLLADYDLNLNLDDKDRNEIHYMISQNSIKEKYNITFSDSIYASANQQAWENQKGTYIWIAIKYSLSNPLHFIKYIFGSSPMVWDITRDSDWIGRAYNTHINNEFTHFYSGNRVPVASYENTTAIHAGTESYNQLNLFVEYASNDGIADTLFNSPALYMYLSILFLILINIITKSREIYLVYLPNLMNILIIFASTPIQDNRYLYPNLLVAYLLITILIGTIIKLKNRKIKTNT